MIEEKKLKDNNFFQQVKIQADILISEDNFREAYDLAKELILSFERVKDFKKYYPQLYNEYRKIIITLRWVGLPVMTEEMVIKMFKYHFVELFKIPDYDLYGKLKTVLMYIIGLEYRDNFKERLREALLKNEQLITHNKLIVNNEEKNPTIANWFSDYHINIGTTNIDKLARTQYLVSSPNISKLSEEEKQVVRTLFDLYEKLKLSSLTPEGIEEDTFIEDDEMQGVLKGGIFEPLPKESERQKKISKIIENFFSKQTEQKNKLADLNSILTQYPPASLERKAIEEEIKKMNSEL